MATGLQKVRNSLPFSPTTTAGSIDFNQRSSASAPNAPLFWRCNQGLPQVKPLQIRRLTQTQPGWLHCSPYEHREWEHLQLPPRRRLWRPCLAHWVMQPGVPGRSPLHGPRPKHTQPEWLTSSPDDHREWEHSQLPPRRRLWRPCLA